MSDIVAADINELAHLQGTELLARYQASLMGVFGTPQRVLVRGTGSLVWDADGNEYLDLLAGIAVNALGHAHPLLNSVATSQMATLGHISNFFTSPTQIGLAEKLLELTAAPAGSKVFFTNSGTEANEAAFKLARRNAGTPQKPRTRIVALEQGFHGRSMGALALTWKQAYREPFEPLPGGVEWVPAGDVDALRAAVDDSVAAIFIEPIQGEAGVVPLPAGYLAAAREIASAAGALLVFDEVQTGIGRTGKWFASEGVLPDAMTLAKGLGGGFPIGALVTFGDTASTLLSAGQHGTTFGGNPVATACALATLHVIESQQLLAHVQTTGAVLREQLATLDCVTEVRGEGLLIGFDLAADVAPALVRHALDAGFIINAPGPRTLRLAPPLIITAEQLGTFVEALPALYVAALAESQEQA
ncbi:acetylornithine transaminase [Paeniglutamicibacter cryotolerans]|uniref:Acetylornithine aminotransferase n=1 Tax=Paeniglutamicibacter cryotolerans TaxID=670079 RepID=A0A839QW65_9MICC|nr:acetylornithine transaminase [Paeniglutamicibacter cryotolerans]MBB2996251.1 acetylornithine aminotransferase [Paeniglutamicibacter cryotolerans]